MESRTTLSNKELWAARVTVAALLSVTAYDILSIGRSAIREYLPTFMFLALPGGLALYLCIAKRSPPFWAWALYLFGGLGLIRLVHHLGHYSSY